MSIMHDAGRRWPILWIAGGALLLAGVALLVRLGSPDQTSVRDSSDVGRAGSEAGSGEGDGAERDADAGDGPGTDARPARDADVGSPRDGAEASGTEIDEDKASAAAGVSAPGADGRPAPIARGAPSAESTGVDAQSAAVDASASAVSEPAYGLPEADYHLGVELAALGRADEAAEAFGRYAAAVPVLADLAHRAAGDALLEAGQAARAAEAYALALAAPAPTSSAVLSAIKLGNARLRLGDHAGAIEAYADAEARAEIDDERAQAIAGTIATHLEAGRLDEANAVRLRLVAELPRTATARASLERLREAAVPVPPEAAAPVLAAAGEHSAALDAIQSAIDAGHAAGAAVPPAWHVLALSSERALGDLAAVRARAEALAASGGAGERAAEVALIRARALEAEGRQAEAAGAMLDLADAFPAAPEAAEALWRRAAIVENLEGELPGAEAHARFAERFPGDARAVDAAFRAGWLRWRAGRLDEAARAWTALAGSPSIPPAQRARAEYWLGRIAAEREGPMAAEARWRAAVGYDPESFHALLAAERLGRPALEAPPAGSGSGSGDGAGSEASGGAGSSGTADGAGARDRAGGALQGVDRAAPIGAWLATWAAGADGASLTAAVAAVAEERQVARGSALLALGEDRAARRALKAVVGEMRGDARRLAAFALHADELGLPDVAIPAASEVLRLAPAPARRQAPAALRRLIYPVAQAELVRAQARAHGLPPSLVFALIWQESRFDPGAVSSAGARGLTQVMPATGEEIANRLGHGGFNVDMLHLPHVSARFGAWYLAEQLARLLDDQRVALAAYNGGPGNARRWLEASGGDLDVFVEAIHLSETRRYLPAVITARAWYERLEPADARP